MLHAQRNRIRSWLSTQANVLRIRDVWSNPEAEPGGRLYANFEHAYRAAGDKSVRLVFHGSPEVRRVGMRRAPCAVCARTLCRCAVCRCAAWDAPRGVAPRGVHLVGLRRVDSSG